MDELYFQSLPFHSVTAASAVTFASFFFLMDFFGLFYGFIYWGLLYFLLLKFFFQPQIVVHRGRIPTGATLAIFTVLVVTYAKDVQPHTSSTVNLIAWLLIAATFSSGLLFFRTKPVSVKFTDR